MKTKSKTFTRYLSVTLLVLLPSLLLFGQTSDGVLKQDPSDSVAIVLIGDGEGVVTKIAPAVAISSAGVLLVPLHVIKDAKEVQVRLKTGEIFDDVALLGSDERRDVAAIRIQASDLPVKNFAGIDEVKQGENLTIFTHSPGKLWTQTAGKLTGSKMADEMLGAGQGFRIIQFDAELSAGMDGGVIFRADGTLVALITREIVAPTNSGFAIPISNIKALGSGERARSFGSGKDLNMPTEASLKAAKNPSTDPKDLFLNSKKVYVETNTTFFKEQQLINELNKRKEIKDWGWIIMTGSWDSRNKADLIIELDHQILSFDFTFSVRHRRTSTMITAGKVAIADGASGAPKMVDKIIKNLNEIVNPPVKKGK